MVGFNAKKSKTNYKHNKRTLPQANGGNPPGANPEKGPIFQSSICETLSWISIFE